MLIEVKVPVLAESVPDATLLDWKKREGEAVAWNEILIELETDKVVLEVPAPRAGVLREIIRRSGDTVHSEEVLARIDTEGKAAEASPDAGGKRSPEGNAAAGTEASDGARAARPGRSGAVGGSAATESGRPQGGRGAPDRSLPDRRDRERGPHHQGRRACSRRRGSSERPGAGKGLLRKQRRPPRRRQRRRPRGERASARGERRERMSRLRARIAERLKDAQNTAAILTTFNEVDMGPVMALRKRYREAFEKAHGVRLGFMSFFARASVQALRRFPAVNARIEGQDIVYHDYCDIGVAVGSPRGLVVPILRNVEDMSFAQIETKIGEFGAKARDGTLSFEEMSGGTFTISNGGVFGSLLSTPILNPPQSAILGMHKTEDRAVVVGGEVVVRPMMYLALSYDHRIIDGREAVLFLVTIKEAIEDPARLLLDV